jgi:hypothetical protein
LTIYTLFETAAVFLMVAFEVWHLVSRSRFSWYRPT